MVCGCIDIGSNTTRLLVAEVSDGRLDERLHSRTFTRMGVELARDGELSPAKLDEVVETVRGYRELAHGEGAQVIRAVATAAIRRAGNRHEVLSSLSARAGVRVELLSGEDEARLAFLGATRTSEADLDGARVGVVDVGGGSTEIAVGTLAGGVEWACSLPVGSGLLGDFRVPSDPPTPAELEAMARAAADALDVAVPGVDVALAVGGSAASLRKVAGPALEAAAGDELVAELCREPARATARRLDLAEERVRLLPAGILILAGVASLLGCPLRLGCGGIREGVCLELAASPPPPGR